MGQIGYKYRLRGLAGRILCVGGADAFSATVLSESVKDTTNRILVRFVPELLYPANNIRQLFSGKLSQHPRANAQSSFTKVELAIICPVVRKMSGDRTIGLSLKGPSTIGISRVLEVSHISKAFCKLPSDFPEIIVIVGLLNVRRMAEI